MSGKGWNEEGREGFAKRQGMEKSEKGGVGA